MSVIDSYLGGRRSWTETVRLLVELVRSRLGRIVQWAGFWTAVFLPFLWLPLLVEGVSTGPEFHALLGMMVANVLAMVVGHRHDPGWG